MFVNRRLQLAWCLFLATGLVQLDYAVPVLAQTTATPVDSDSTTRLIDQLGSPTYAEREDAGKALRKLGTKALPPLREAAKKGKDLEIRRRAAVLVGQIENSLEALLEFYCELGLPLPPAGARLVRFDTGVGGGTSDGKTIHFQALGFVLLPTEAGKLPVLLVGTEEFKRTSEMEKYRGKLKLIDVNPDERVPEQIRAQWLENGFEVNAGLATALQCRAEGHEGFAQILWDRFAGAEAEKDNSLFHHPPNLAPRRDVAQLAWAHYGNELSKPKSDRQAIVKKIRALMKSEPSFVSKEKEELLHSLELALLPSRAPVNSVERMIDDLTDLSGPRKFPGDQEADIRYRRLCDLGFAAVPDLIKHLDDPRLTRVMWRPFHHGPPELCRIGELMHDILYSITGFDIIREWRNGHSDPNGEKEDARNWFATAKKIGEEAYYTQHIIPNNPQDERFNAGMLHLILIKYPKQLPVIYRKIVDTKSKTLSWELVQAIIDSAMPNTEKVALFTYATQNARMVDREAAHRALKQLEKKAQPAGKQNP